jgi:fatty acid desaturase
MDIEAFAAEIRAIGAEAAGRIGAADYRHMRAIGLSGRLAFAAGLLACIHDGVAVAALLFCYSLLVRWLLMHHVGHGGYNRVAGLPPRFQGSNYAEGWRRYIDWFDWIQPAAWKHEHNKLHHFHAGEDEDPDLVEANLSWLAESRWPLPFKLALLASFAATWKFTYYSARTLSCLPGLTAVDFRNFLDLRRKAQRIMWLQLFLPYVAVHFVALPLLLEIALPGLGATFLLARIAAELLHNVHMFIVIVPNHAGEDMCRYTQVGREQRTAGHFYLRQVLTSANYSGGREWLDLGQMYLNYQIEHHLFPALSMLQYRRIQPLVKAACERHGVPYVQESVWLRLYRMVQIAVGARRMQRVSDPVAHLAARPAEPAVARAQLAADTV